MYATLHIPSLLKSYNIIQEIIVVIFHCKSLPKFYVHIQIQQFNVISLNM